jgi:Zn-dependent peptidase ImmA (M78 family)
MGLVRGFASYAELLAEEIRRELNLSLFVRLDPFALARHLDITVIGLSALPALANADSEAVRCVNLLAGAQQEALSAITVFRGPERVIVHNDSHTAGRQASNLCHELSHGLLLHEPRPALDRLGCRDWDGQIEEEADFLGSTLLVPGKAARGAAKRGMSAPQIAAQYGCSTQMAQWRLNASGATHLKGSRMAVKVSG